MGRWFVLLVLTAVFSILLPSDRAMAEQEATPRVGEPDKAGESKPVRDLPREAPSPATEPVIEVPNFPLPRGSPCASWKPKDAHIKE